MRLSSILARLSLGTLLCSVAACSDASLSGNTGSQTATPAKTATVSGGAAPNANATASGSNTAALGNAVPGTTSQLAGSSDAANGSGSATGEGSAAVAGSGSASAANAGPLTISKTIGGIALEDKAATITITALNSDGSSAGSATASYAAGAQGQQQLAGLCNPNGPTNVAVKISVPGLSSSQETLAPGSSSVSFDPTTCIVSQFLSGGKGDSFAFTCPAGPVVVRN